jgi:hypothetical protein
MDVSLLEQDQSECQIECQIECQNRARESLSQACECLRGLVLFEVSAVGLR